MNLRHFWDELCLHAVFHDWNPIWLLLDDFRTADIHTFYGGVYPGWGVVDWDALQ